MDAFITGGTGSLGRHLVRFLAERGDRVRVFARPSSRRDEIARYVARWHEGDLLDRPSLERAMGAADAVFHLAARVDFRLDDPGGMRRTNVEGTENVLAAAALCGPRRIVHVSTIGAVGAPRAPVAVDESFAWNLGGIGLPYFDTKRAAEERALEAARAGLPVVIVNPSLTIAPPWPGRRLRPALARLLSGAPVPFSLRTGLNLVDQRDVVATLTAAALRGRVGERYLVSGENKTVDEILEIRRAITGARVPAWHLPRTVLAATAAFAEFGARISGSPLRVHRPLARLLSFFWFYDASKARRELAHTPRPLATTLEEIAREVRGEVSSGAANLFRT